MATLRRLLDDAHRGAPQFLVLTGRRRVGKSTLVRRFVSEHAAHCRVVLFNATHESDTVQRERLREALVDAGITPPSSQWSDLLGAALTSPGPPLVLAIDEAPYLLNVNAGWASVLQHAWDQSRDSRDGNAPLLILTGSAISTILTVISSAGPLFGRPTHQLMLDPLDLPSSHELLGHPEPRRTIEAYSACGGYPLFLNLWNPELAAEANLLRLVDSPVAPLFAGADSLLLEMADIPNHRRVLTAIGGGDHKQSKINQHVRAERPLKALERAGFVARRTPISERSPKQAQYRISDGYLRFWFEVIEPFLSAIEAGQAATALRMAEGRWNAVVAATFEEGARHHARRLVAAGELEPALIGEWWSDTGQQGQVDVVGVAPKRWRLAGEVKWSNEFRITDLRQLERNLSIARQDAARLTLASWSIHGPAAELQRMRSDMRHFTAADVVDQ